MRTVIFPYFKNQEKWFNVHGVHFNWIMCFLLKFYRIAGFSKLEKRLFQKSHFQQFDGTLYQFLKLINCQWLQWVDRSEDDSITSNNLKFHWMCSVATVKKGVKIACVDGMIIKRASLKITYAHRAVNWFRLYWPGKTRNVRNVEKTFIFF